MSGNLVLGINQRPGSETSRENYLLTDRPVRMTMKWGMKVTIKKNNGFDP